MADDPVTQSNSSSHSSASIASSAAQPDLDWSQVKETVLMLRLAAAQIEFSLRDGNSSVDVLTDSFTSMAESMRNISDSSRSLFEKHQIQDEQSSAVLNHCDNVTGKVQAAIVAFQFYDKLVQRLDHVVESMSKLGELVGDASRLYSPAEWQALQDQIRSRYSMPQERELFDSLMSGGDIQVLLTKMMELSKNPPDEDDIELF